MSSTLAKTALTLVLLLVYGMFISSVFVVFKQKGRQGSGLVWIKIGTMATIAAIISMLWRLDEINSALFGLSLGVVLLAGALYIWAERTTRNQRFSLAFCDDTPTFLVAEGPYQFVRHPFYASYVMGYGGGCLASINTSIIPTVFVTAMFCIYFAAAKIEEDKFRRSSFREAYEIYRSRTGMLFPRWVQIGKSRTI